jgi:uncharacterized membrane protein YbhN (UPF0104 family)
MGDLGGEGCLLPPAFAKALCSWSHPPYRGSAEKVAYFFMKKVVQHIKHVIPWIFAVLIFIYLFHLYPPSKVLKSLTYVNPWAFSAFSIGYFILIYLVDAGVMTRVLSKFSYKVSFKDIVLARGFTYLIMVVNYPASQVAFAYYLKRRYRIPIFEALGIFLLIVYIDLLWIVTLALTGSFFQDYTIKGADLGRIVRIFAIGVYIFTFVWLAFWRRWAEKMFGHSIRIPLIERLRKRPVFHTFEQARAVDYLKIAIMRIPIHFTIIISMYVVLKTFGVSIPFTTILGNVPLVFFIGTLPITPGGLGTTNAALVELLYRHVSGPIFATGNITPQEILFTATLLWMFVNYLFKIITGIFSLRHVSKHLFEPTPEEPEEEVLEHEAAHMGGNI